MSGSIRVLWNEADSAVVTIYGPTGTAATGFKVNGNAVTFPYTLSASTTFTTNHIDRYSISVTYYGTEIAATPDGERVVDLGDSDELVFAPSPDAGKVMAPANDATLTAIFNDTSSDFRAAQAAAFVARTLRKSDRTRAVGVPQPAASIQRSTATMVASSSRDSTGAVFYGVKNGSQIVKSTDNGATYPTTVQDLLEPITGIHVLPDGRLLVATGQVDSNNPSTYIHLWRATDTTNTTLVRVDGDAFTPGGYILPWAMSSLGNDVIVSSYGYKVGTGINKARYAWVSNDNGATWRQAYDIGGVDNRHAHCVHIDRLGVMWGSQGDDTDVDAKAVRRSDDRGNTWTLHFITDEFGQKIQLTGMADTADADGWVYGMSDSSGACRIYRWQSDDFDGTLEVCYDAGQTPTGAAPWAGPGYTIGADPVANVLYALIPGGANARGRFMWSADGVNWRILMETSQSSLTPPASSAAFAFGANYVAYDTYFLPRLTPYRQQGVQRGERLRITARVSGTLTNGTTTVITFDPVLEGYGLVRVTNCYLYLGTASSTGAVQAMPKRAGVALASIAAAVAQGATGDALRAKATMINNPSTILNGLAVAAGTLLTVDLSAIGTDAANAQVVLELEAVTDSGWAKSNTA